MLKGGVARRYARAAFELALEDNDLDGWLSDLKNVSSMIREPAVAEVLQNVRVPRSEKVQLVSRLLAGLRPLTLNLALLLVTKNRTDIVDDIAQAYEELLNDHRGVAVAEVVTAVPVDDGEKVVLIDQLSRISGKRIILHTRVDPQIVGGIVARIGDKVLDGSLRTRLLLLRRSLVGTAR